MNDVVDKTSLIIAQSLTLPYYLSAEDRDNLSHEHILLFVIDILMREGSVSMQRRPWTSIIREVHGSNQPVAHA